MHAFVSDPMCAYLCAHVCLLKTPTERVNMPVPRSIVARLSPPPHRLLDYMLFYKNLSNPSDWWQTMRPSQSASFKDQVRSLTFRVVCYTGESDPSRLAWKFTVSWSLYSVTPERKMSILFKATLYVCSHDHSYIDIRGVQCCKTTDLSVQMN